MAKVPTTRWQASMFALMVVARPVTNRELRGLAGLEITADVRREAAGHVSRAHGRQDEAIIKESAGSIHTYRLSDLGKSWCDSALLAGRPDDAKFPAGVLYSVLESVGQHLARSGTKFEEFFQPDIEAWIRAAYTDLTTRRPGSWVMLSVLRPRLRDVPRDVVDAALDRLIESPEVDIAQEATQSALTDADRDAAVRIGGQERHRMKIEVSA
jgi:hypothetical protein